MLTIVIVAVLAGAAPCPPPLQEQELPAPQRLEPPDVLPPAPEGKRWQLVWHDEFDGEQLDLERWEHASPGEGRKRRDGWWTPEAVSLDGEGHLVMRTLEKEGRFLDGCIRTRGKFEPTFGYFVARVELQRQPGHWSAFWLYTGSVNRVGDEGRDGTEIDVFEKPWLDDRVQHTLHWDGYGEHHRSAGHVSHNPGIMEGFHTFALLWSAEEYVFHVDGRETWRTRDGGVSRVPTYLKLSDEVGSWGGDIREAELPDSWRVDYVRVYQLRDESGPDRESEGNSSHPPGSGDV